MNLGWLFFCWKRRLSFEKKKSNGGIVIVRCSSHNTFKPGCRVGMEIDMLQNMTYITVHCRYGQVSIHRGCVEKIGCPEYVQILVSVETHQLLLRSATSNEKDTYAVPKSIYETKAIFGINGKMLTDKFAALMNWKRKCAYRVDGILTDDGMMLFDLDLAEPVEDWHENMVTGDDDRLSEQ